MEKMQDKRISFNDLLQPGYRKLLSICKYNRFHLLSQSQLEGVGTKPQHPYKVIEFVCEKDHCHHSLTSHFGSNIGVLNKPLRKT